MLRSHFTSRVITHGLLKKFNLYTPVYIDLIGIKSLATPKHIRKDSKLFQKPICTVNNSPLKLWAVEFFGVGVAGLTDVDQGELGAAAHVGSRL